MRRFKLNRLPEYTDKAIITEIRRVAKLVSSKKLTIPAFQKHANVGVNTLRRHFGSWRKALRAAGLEHLYNDRIETSEKMRCQKAKGMSDGEVLEQVRHVTNKLRKNSISIEEFDGHAPISGATVRKRFGSWRAGLEKAGLRASKLGSRYTDEECFENLLKVWTHYGRAPKCDEMQHAPSTIGYRGYARRWGSWNKALHAFVKRANQDLSSTEKKEQKPKEEKVRVHAKSHLADSEKREIKLGLRYGVLKRDNFRCVLCGRSPATHLGLQLQVDHINPFSKGGKTVLENLRCLCKECNLGKGVKLEKKALGKTRG
jgi:hypothetical protein